jgi:hypothetical protein
MSTPGIRLLPDASNCSSETEAIMIADLVRKAEEAEATVRHYCDRYERLEEENAELRRRADGLEYEVQKLFEQREAYWSDGERFISFWSLVDGASAAEHLRDLHIMVDALSRCGLRCALRNVYAANDANRLVGFELRV